MVLFSSKTSTLYKYIYTHTHTHIHTQTSSFNDTGDDSTHGHHQMVNTEIRLIIFPIAKDGEALYCQ